MPTGKPERCLGPRLKLSLLPSDNKDLIWYEFMIKIGRSARNVFQILHVIPGRATTPINNLGILSKDINVVYHKYGQSDWWMRSSRYFKKRT